MVVTLLIGIAELRFDTTKTALGELTERLLASDLPAPAPA